ncbi:MAG: T9SS type A sorting domain-containing protein [Bacteroidia bacterium]
MRKLILTILFLTTWATFTTGQNLVPNGDFEQYYHCPTYVSQIDSAKFWFKASAGTSDYFNQCGSSYANIPNTFLGFQQARSGVAFSGFYVWNELPYYQVREYIEVALDSSLTTNGCYHFEMYINLGNTSRYTTNNIDVYFSDTLFFGGTGTNLPLTPQLTNTIGNSPDTLNWTLVSGDYTAVGGENYIIIGNFKNGPSTDTSIYNYSSSADFAYVFVDDVSLTRCLTNGLTGNNKEIKTSLFPNPFTDLATLQFDNSKKENCTLTLYDLHGQAVRTINNIITGKVEIERQSLVSGLYFFQLRTDRQIIATGKLTIE